MSDFKKHIIRSGVTTGVVVVLLAVFLLLFRANINHQSQIIQELAGRRNSYTQASQGLALLIKDWDVAQQYSAQVQSLVPKKDDIVLLSKELQTRALKDNVSIAFSFNAAGETAPQQNGIASIGFSATLEGNAKDILSFLQEVERSYYALQIQSFDLTTGITNNAAISRFFVSGKVFFHE